MQAPMQDINGLGPTSTVTDNPSPDFYIGLAREAYTSSTSYFDASIRPQINAAIRQHQGVHPVNSKYLSDNYRNRSRLFRPKTRGMTRKAEAVGAEALFATAEVISCKPEDDGNPRNMAAAALMKELIEHRLRKSIPWFLTTMGAYQDSLVAGIVISRQYWDYDTKRRVDKPCVDLIATENFRFDPGASWIDPVNTSPYCIRRVPMFVKDARAKMKAGDWKLVSDQQMLVAASHSSDITRLTRERNRIDPKQNPTSITDFTVIWCHENVMDVDGEDMVWWTLDTVALLTEAKPVGEVYRHCEDGGRPFVVGYSAIETHKNYPDGPVGITRDVQSEINEVANSRIDNVKFAMNKRYFVRRQSQVDIRSITRNVPGSATLVQDVDKDVKVVDFADVTASAYQEQDRLNSDFDDVAGNFSSSSVQTNRKLNETVGGMQLLNANTNQVGAYQLRTFIATWAQPVLQQIAAMEARYETDEKILTRAAARAGLQQEFDIHVIDDMLMSEEVAIEVDVGYGSTNPADQINNFVTAINALKTVLDDGTLMNYGVDAGEVIKEVFGKLGYRDGKRFFDQDQDPQVTFLKNQLQELQQKLERKQDPALVQAMVGKLSAEAEALQAKNHFSMMQALEAAARSIFATHQTGQMVAAVPQIAPVADAILSTAAQMSGNPNPGAEADGAVPAQPVPGLTQNAIKDPRDGIQFDPAAAVQAAGAGPAAGDTSPQTPENPTPQAVTGGAPAMPAPQAPGSSTAGAEIGINTPQP